MYVGMSLAMGPPTKSGPAAAAGITKSAGSTSAHANASDTTLGNLRCLKSMTLPSVCVWAGLARQPILVSHLARVIAAHAGDHVPEFRGMEPIEKMDDFLC